MRFDRFTQRAQESIARSQEILLRYQHSQMDLEHVLLALLEQPEGAVSGIFELLGADLEMMKRRVDHILRAQPKVRGGTRQVGMAAQIFVTPAVQRLAGIVSQEADKLNEASDNLIDAAINDINDEGELKNDEDEIKNEV